MNDEAVPQSPPYTITVTWSIGDSIIVSYPDLHSWEARVALEEAVEIVRADERADSEEVEA